jgi:hypothetical protein
MNRLVVGSDEFGVAIGVEGFFRWDRGTLVVAIDADYGAGTGPRELSNLVAAPGIATDLDLPEIPDESFGAEYLLLSTHGADPRLYDAPSGNGLFAMADFARHRVATNYAEDVRGTGALHAATANSGFEASIPWSELGLAAMQARRLAVWAILIDDDAGATNQSLPPWQDYPEEPGAPLIYDLDATGRPGP